MTYLPELNLWSPGIAQAIRSGQLKIQRGQWLRCGNNPHPCRFVGLTPGGTLHVVHWRGSKAATNAHFLRCVQSHRESEQAATSLAE